MEIDELVDKIAERFKTEEYYFDSTIGYTTILSKYNKSSVDFFKKILKQELLNFITNLNTDAIEYKNKCEIYEILISNSNFKMATEKINNRKKKEVKKDDM